ncbi:MAG TPA: M14 family zinc carboxypeptidase [Streptosporangiaceae bacterium]|nr:M14 family zinc carboxypeptidase [Streptosporangiaceae bacterium]
MLDAAVLVDRVPQIDRIPSIDELIGAFRDLASRHPHLFRLRRIGASRLGEPLLMLTAGHGSRQALLVGGPHPNEPVGFLTLLHLARRLADDADLRDGMDYTWNLVPCIDPDGARLNEGWYRGPLTIEHYHRHFYRPALRNQPEWTFPMSNGSAFFDRPLPETQALMRVIDELRPRFQYSLHNADFGAAYFVLNRDIPGLAGRLADAARACQIPLELAPSEAVGWGVAGPAVFVMPPAHEMFTNNDNGDKSGPHFHGASSLHYAERHGTFTLITEAPMWREAHPDWGQHPPNAHMLPTMAAGLRRDLDELEGTLRRVTPEIRTSLVFYRAVADALVVGRAYVKRWETAAAYTGEAGRSLVAAELAGAKLTSWRIPLRAAAMLRRLLCVECESGNHRPVLRAELAATEERFARGCARALEGAFEPVPMRDLVALQLSAALTTIAHL